MNEGVSEQKTPEETVKSTTVKNEKKQKIKVVVKEKNTTGTTIKLCALVALIFFVVAEFVNFGIIIPIFFLVMVMIFANEISSLVNIILPFFKIIRKRLHKRADAVREELDRDD